MAIDYDSGAGLFDKLGPVVRQSNLFEEFEVGDMNTALTELLGKLDTVNEYDDASRREFYALDASLRSTMRGWKQDILELVLPILRQEMDEAEGFYSQNLSDLLKYLVFCMKRDAESVLQTTITVAAPAAIGAPVGDFTVVASDYASTVQGADAASQENGIIWDNDYRIVCTNNGVTGAETFEVRGNMPKNGRTHPSWQNAGMAGTLLAVSSVSGRTLLTNGGYENLNAGATALADWAVTVGAYGVNVHQTAAAGTFYRGAKALKLDCVAANPKITQSLAVDTLKPWTKYLVTAKLKKSNAAADGTVNIGFATAGFSIAQAVGGIGAASFGTYTAFFNTGADPGAITDFFVELTGGVSGHSVYVDEVTLSEVPLFHGLGLAVIAGATDPALDDAWAVNVTNNAEGKFMNFFGRWFDLLLPGTVAGTIVDALAT